MTLDRRHNLKAGAKEVFAVKGVASLTLYWEPYMELRRGHHYPCFAYTLDYTNELKDKDTRYRFATLEEADAKWDKLHQEIVTTIAKAALRLN